MDKKINKAQLNHLRRVLAYLEYEIGQPQEEIIGTSKNIAEKLDGIELSEEARQRMVASYEKAQNIPKYVRDGIKSLKKLLEDQEVDFVEGGPSKNQTLSEQKKLGR